MCGCCEYDNPDEHRNAVRRTRGCAVVLMTAGISVMTLGVILTIEFAPNFQTEQQWALNIAIALTMVSFAVLLVGIFTCVFVQQYLSGDWGQLRIKMVPKNKADDKQKLYQSSTP